jgi:hypothetical protein
MYSQTAHLLLISSITIITLGTIAYIDLKRRLAILQNCSVHPKLILLNEEVGKIRNQLHAMDKNHKEQLKVILALASKEDEPRHKKAK